ncbi:hypothetical protein [Mumia sp. DW29H23]|uniref:hypothetical protein n=1 Tax=Mumia sp. DW29H23 TaxID=3421241 RepID=UPI003D686AFB
MRSTRTTWLGGLLIGLVLGCLARGVMRLVVVVEDADPAFSWVGSALIVSLFVLAAVGATLAGRLRAPLLVRLVVAALFAAPVTFFGIGIGAQEIAWATEGETGGVVGVVIALAGLIGVIALASVVVPWRWAAARRPRAVGKSARP